MNRTPSCQIDGFWSLEMERMDKAKPPQHLPKQVVRVHDVSVESRSNTTGGGLGREGGDNNFA